MSLAQGVGAVRSVEDVNRLEVETVGHGEKGRAVAFGPLGRGSVQAAVHVDETALRICAIRTVEAPVWQAVSDALYGPQMVSASI